MLGISAGIFAGIIDGLEAYAKGDYKTAFNELKPFAEQGNTDSQFFLGTIYAGGHVVLRDKNREYH